MALASIRLFLEGIRARAVYNYAKNFDEFSVLARTNKVYEISAEICGGGRYTRFRAEGNTFKVIYDRHSEFNRSDKYNAEVKKEMQEKAAQLVFNLVHHPSNASYLPGEKPIGSVFHERTKFFESREILENIN